MARSSIWSDGWGPHQAFVGLRLLRRLAVGVLVLSVAGLLAGCGTQQPTSGQDVSGAIENTGSDTLVNLAVEWAEAYMDLHPEVRLSVTGGGSGTGIAAMINGTVDIAIVVHPSNPVEGLTLRQVSDIYTGKVTNWRRVGGEDRPIVILSRESNSGTYVYFLENVIRLGKEERDLLFSPDTLLMPSSEGISAEVRHNPNAIGYDGLGYVTSDQKVVAVARDADSPYVLPSVDTVNDGSYPISRPLYMYTAGKPTGQVKAYLDWVQSDGQSIVPELGFVPLRESARAAD